MKQLCIRMIIIAVLLIFLLSICFVTLQTIGFQQQKDPLALIVANIESKKNHSIIFTFCNEMKASLQGTLDENFIHNLA